MTDNLGLAVRYMLFASLLFSFMGVFVRELSDTMSSIEIAFFRNLFGVIIILYTVWRNPFQQVGGKLPLLIFRGVMGFTALLAFFYNIANIPLADAMTFSKTAPVFTAFFAYLFLGEKLNPIQIISMFVGFIGIIFIIQPNGFTFSKTDLLGIFSGVGAALAYTSVRELKKYYDSRAIVLSFAIVGTISPIILLLIGSFFETPKTLDFMFAPFVLPTTDDIIPIFALGIFATVAQLFMTKAYGEAKAGIVGTISYSNIVFSTLLGTFVLGDVFPNIWTIFGMILIVISGIFATKTKSIF
ncbi:putative membrane protein [Thiovulum sp. ES]|nr:putative membrane protein [Thiovulum sp. ES]